MTDWAKASDFANDPVRSAAVHLQTVADKHAYMDEGQTQVRCAACAAEVLVRKNTNTQTSIQWLEDASGCHERAGSAESTGLGQMRRVGNSCPMLRAAIARAVEAGAVVIHSTM